MYNDYFLQVGGINLRNANYDFAANVFRQLTDSVRIEVKYNPHSKFIKQ